MSYGVAVVSGGAAGLGAVFVRTLRSMGHDVALLDLTSVPETSEPNFPGRLIACKGDAADPGDVSAFADTVRTQLGRPRVLVNCVGSSPYRGFAEETLDGWRTVMAVNVESAVLMTQAFLDDLRAVPDARVVNLASSVLWDAEIRGMAAYIAAKGAVVGLTRALAGELGESDVTVNAIAPGIVRTPGTKRVSAGQLETYRRRQAVPRIASPEDMASTLEYLVSPRSRHVTGVVVGVNGGRVWL
jgi:NAD(P)-dependent dehydrogenase (short-subunit alcohol dehydrogenase family)